MGKKNITIILCLTIIGTILISPSFVWNSKSVTSGSGSESNCGPTKISKPNGRDSHFFGLNCMSCHTEGRKGPGCFTIGGSVLDEDRSKIHKNPVIKLYTEPRGKGKLVATIQGDAFGNFYTTENIEFSTGIYATLIGSPGAAEPIKHMTRTLIKGMGKCNKCHGYTEEALGID